ncbi:hypothetical protein HZH66_009610 [Vespula vulgaris]|uniref:Ephrin RBD domain-containing protein n=1 Tax=Vespula vulgaris TaxID=7454 RepID=A0A834N0B7_VESVU|nr:hypothetical protein HZH66_009610 [Vespula vulgaris]
MHQLNEHAEIIPKGVRLCFTMGNDKRHKKYTEINEYIRAWNPESRREKNDQSLAVRVVGEIGEWPGCEFRIDNTDHIIDVNKNNAVFEYDQVNIICPMYQLGTYDPEKYLIYNVSKEEYETCRITNPSPRLIAICDKPYEDKYYTITFRPFTPQPGGLEFLPGHDYYFISTSSKEDLHRRIGGRCTSDNMKVVFKVCCSNDTSSSSATSRNNSVTVTSSTVPSSSSTSTAVLGGGAGGMMPPPPPPSVLKGGERFYPGGNIHHHRDHHQPATVMPTHVPPSALYPVHPHQPQPPIHNGPPSVSSPPKTSIGQKKKNKEYSDHPNEVVKNEELTYNGAASYGFGQVLFLMVSSVLISALMPQLLR